MMSHMYSYVDGENHLFTRDLVHTVISISFKCLSNTLTMVLLLQMQKEIVCRSGLLAVGSRCCDSYMPLWTYFE